MAETGPTITEQEGENSAPEKVLEERVKGEVKWFNVKSGYGFIRRLDQGDDVFVHHSAISRDNHDRSLPSLKDGEEVEFFLVKGRKGHEAYHVTGPGGAPVQGSTYAFPRGRGRGFGYRGGPFMGGYPPFNDYNDYGGRGRGPMNPYGGRARPFRGRIGGGRGRGFRGRGFSGRGGSNGSYDRPNDDDVPAENGEHIQEQDNE